MKAQILTQPGPIDTSPLQLSDVPRPVPTTGQVLLQVHVCGVCHTDLHVIEDELPSPKLPLIPGH